MAEGLSASEVGKQLAEHRAQADERAEHAASTEKRKTDVITILEAVLLAVVAVLAAWSGYAAAKWGTDSSLHLAKASAARTKANRAALNGLETKNFDSTTFNAWFTAYLLHDQAGMAVAERRFRQPFDVAFRAWMATDPFHNPNSPRGPTYIREYVQPDGAKTAALDAQADALYALGATDGSTSDGYVRTTVYLATVLFLVGISGHFVVRSARIGLIATGGAILFVSVVLLVLAPKPPL